MLLELFSGTIMPAQKDRIALEYVNDCKAKLNANPISVMIKGLLEADPTVRCVWHKQRSPRFLRRVPTAPLLTAVQNRMTCGQALQSAAFVAFEAAPPARVLTKHLTAPASEPPSKKSKTKVGSASVALHSSCLAIACMR